MGDKRVRYTMEFDLATGSSRVLDETGKQLAEINDHAEDAGKRGAEGIFRLDARMLALAGSLGLSGAALGAWALNALRASGEAEALETRLVSLKGSEDAAADSFGRFREIAATTPFELKDVVEAGVALEAFGADADRTLKAVTDLAAFMGTTASEAAQSLGRAWAAGAAGAAVLRQRGVLAMVAMREGVDDLSNHSLPEFRRALFEAMVDPTGQIAGSTDRLARTWVGSLSNVADAHFGLNVEVGNVITQSDVVKGAVVAYRGRVDELSGAIHDWTQENRELIEQGLDVWLRGAAEGGNLLLGTLQDISAAIGAINRGSQWAVDNVLAPLIDWGIIGAETTDWRFFNGRSGSLQTDSARARIAAGAIDPLQDYLDELANAPTVPFRRGPVSELMRPPLPPPGGVIERPDFSRGGSGDGDGDPGGAKKAAKAVREVQQLDAAARALLATEDGRLRVEEARLGYIREDLTLARRRGDAESVLLGMALEMDQHQRAILEARREQLIAQAQLAVAENASGVEIARIRSQIELANLELERSPQHAAQLADELGRARDQAEAAAVRTIDLGASLSQGLRRSVDASLTRGEWDLADIFRDSGRAMSSDLFGAMLEEKLSFDSEIEANFLGFIPDTIGAGVDKIRGIWGRGMDDLGASARDNADGVFRAYDGAFQRIGGGAGQLGALFGGPLFGRGLGNVEGGRVIVVGGDGGHTVVEDAFGSTFSGRDVRLTLNAASGMTQPGEVTPKSSGAFGNITGTALAVVGLLSPVIDEALGRNARTYDSGVIRASIPQPPSATGKSFGETVAINTATGALVGSIFPGIGTVAGAAVGALAGVIIGAIDAIFGGKKISHIDLIGKGLAEGPFAENQLLLQQGVVRVNRRGGIASDRLEHGTDLRQGFLERMGLLLPEDIGKDDVRSSFENITRTNVWTSFGDGYTLDDIYIDPADGKVRLRPELVDGLSEGAYRRTGGGLLVGTTKGTTLDPQQAAKLTVLERDPRFAPTERDMSDAMAVAAFVGGGNREKTRTAFNALMTNITGAQIEFEDERRRQFLGVMDAMGIDLFNGIELLSNIYNRAAKDWQLDGQPESQLTRDTFMANAAALFDLMRDDLPAGFDIMRLIEQHTGDTSVNVGAIHKAAELQIRILGDLQDSMQTSLKGAIAFQAGTPSAQHLAAAGAPIHDIIGAARMGRAPMISALIDGMRDSMATAITEGVFDAAKSTPAWQALHEQIAFAVQGGGSFDAIPALVGATVAEVMPLIEAQQQAWDVVHGAMAVTPMGLMGQADALSDRAEAARFGRLTPQQQRAALERRLGVNQSLIDRILADGVVDERETPEYQRLLQERGDLGFDLFGLSGSLGFSNNARGRRERAAFEDSALGIVDEAVAATREFATAQVDLYERQERIVTRQIEVSQQAADNTKVLALSMVSLATSIDRVVADIPRQPGLAVVMVDAIRRSPSAQRDLATIIAGAV